MTADFVVERIDLAETALQAKAIVSAKLQTAMDIAFGKDGWDFDFDDIELTAISLPGDSDA